MTVLDVRALVLAKAPVAGRVKTRLCPPYTHAQAATLAAAALADTIRAVACSAASRRTLVLDGQADLVSTIGFDVVQQSEGGLDERIAAAFGGHAGAQILVGMDTPQITPELLDEVMATLLDSSVDAVIGPAEDGGYWAVGIRYADAAAFVGVPMSRPWTYVAQRERFDRLGLRVATLPSLRDVDDAFDARCVADLAPATLFAAALRAMDFERAALC